MMHAACVAQWIPPRADCVDQSIPWPDHSPAAMDTTAFLALSAALEQALPAVLEQVLQALETARMEQADLRHRMGRHEARLVALWEADVQDLENQRDETVAVVDRLVAENEALRAEALRLRAENEALRDPEI